MDRSPELSFLEVDRLEEEEEVLVDDMVAEPRSEMPKITLKLVYFV